MADKTIDVTINADMSGLAARLRAAADALTAKPCDCARHDAYAAREAEQREAAAPDPLDEDDHRDRMTPNGTEWRRTIAGCWHPTASNVQSCRRCHWSLAFIQSLHGTVAFAPEAAQEATGGDLSASEAESGAEEGGDADNAQNAILCPECDDHINTHNMEGCRRHRCDCPRTPEDVARALIAGRWAGKCLHEWAEDTCVGDTARHFICTECGATRTEDRQ